MKAAGDNNKTAPWHDYLDSSNNRTRVQIPQNINRTGPNKKRITVQKPKKNNRGGAIIWNSRVLPQTNIHIQNSPLSTPHESLCSYILSYNPTYTEEHHYSKYPSPTASYKHTHTEQSLVCTVWEFMSLYTVIQSDLYRRTCHSNYLSPTASYKYTHTE